MAHVIEKATTGRAKCRGCDRKIAKDELRFGERQPNAFGDGEMTSWFHLRCAAYTRPEPFLEILESAAPSAAEALAPAARFGIAHRRLPRVHGAERASTGRAHCRSCRELIEQGTWRIPLVFFEDIRLQRSGFVHAKCTAQYFETTEIFDRIAYFSPELTASDLEELRGEVQTQALPR
jgi:hypothetical protein